MDKVSNKPAPALATKTPERQNASPAVEKRPSDGMAGKLPAGNDAAKGAIAAGGLKGGRAREDGLIPGTEEARAADRKKDRDRKARDRELVAKSNPNALPSRPVGPLVENAPMVSDSVGMPSVGDAPVIPWGKEDTFPAIDQSVSLYEDYKKTLVLEAVEAAHLPAPLEKEMLEKAKWPDKPRSQLVNSGASAAAKGLNYMGVPVKYRDAVTAVPALIMLVKHDLEFHKRMKEIIKAANPPVTGKPEEKKPGA